jgi:hypothetical protein
MLFSYVMAGRLYAPVAWFSLGLGVSTACGTSSGGSGAPPAPTSTSVNGTVGGVAVAAVETLGLVGVDHTSGSPYAGAMIWNHAGMCPLLQSGMTAPASSTLLAFQVFNLGTSNPVAAGTYPVGMSADHAHETIVTFLASDAMCTETTHGVAQAGTVKLDSVNSTAVSGSVDVTFQGGDHLTGQFYGPLCNLDLGSLGRNGSSGCGGTTQHDP